MYLKFREIHNSIIPRLPASESIISTLISTFLLSSFPNGGMKLPLQTSSGIKVQYELSYDNTNVVSIKSNENS
ncbi:hypothetical protein 7t3_0552 [Salmonella phage 7t3]|nr:hypothetical protein 7t3_0552 [Salmonella phage 7t3]